MSVKITQHCTHGDKEYETGDIVKAAKIANILLAAGVAEEITKDSSDDSTE